MAENPQINEQEQEAIRLKSLAESKYNSSNLKLALNYANRAHNLCPNLSGLSEMLTAFKILHSSLNPRKTPNNLEHPFPSPDLYDILGVTPFSSLSIIKAQYKKLALLLHPDKNTLKNVSSEAFKLVNDAFQVFSDKGKRRVYDTRLRLALLEEKEVSEDDKVVADEEMFWTMCSKCRLRHRFERNYVGQRLVCPSCEHNFEAVEVGGGDDDDDDDEGEEEVLESFGIRESVGVEAPEAVVDDEVDDWEISSLSELMGKGRLNQRPKNDQKKREFGLKRKMGSVNEVLEREDCMRVEPPIVEDRRKSRREKTRKDYKKLAKSGLWKELVAEKVQVDDRKGSAVVGEEVEMSENDERNQEKNRGVDELEDVIGGDGDELEELTLAEMQMKVSRKSKGKKEDGKRKVAIRQVVEVEDEEEVLLLNKKKRVSVGSGDLEVMTVEDSDFYDFDRDRVERSFKKGQVWSIYDDDDGMPRHYGLIDEVVSVKPFVVKMSWLDFENDGIERLTWEERGFHVSCGKFKVGRKDDVRLLNIFSHLVACERAAKELYLIYPRKGSVWALYDEKELDSEGRNSLSSSNKRAYDIVLLLTSYSDVYGVSMAYLEKVDGYKAVFRRREIGYNAIRWVGKNEMRLFSHQIPARVLSEDEAPRVLGDCCWELDPASLPQDLLALLGA